MNKKGEKVSNKKERKLNKKQRKSQEEKGESVNKINGGRERCANYFERKNCNKEVLAERVVY